jgi:hypothetical protein
MLVDSALPLKVHNHAVAQTGCCRLEGSLVAGRSGPRSRHNRQQQRLASWTRRIFQSWGLPRLQSPPHLYLGASNGGLENAVHIAHLNLLCGKLDYSQTYSP